MVFHEVDNQKAQVNMRLSFNSVSSELSLNDINCGVILSTSEYADKLVFEAVGYKNDIINVLEENEIEHEIKSRVQEGFYFCGTWIKFEEPREYPPILTFHLSKSKITAKTVLVG